MSAEPVLLTHPSKLNVKWSISGCTVHNSLNKEYCIKSCRIREHCTVYVSIMNEREKVQFT